MICGVGGIIVIDDAVSIAAIGKRTNQDTKAVSVDNGDEAGVNKVERNDAGVREDFDGGITIRYIGFSSCWESCEYSCGGRK